MQKKHVWRAFASALAVVLFTGACNLKSGSGGDPVPLEGRAAPIDLSVQVVDAPQTGAFSGHVVDELGAPVASARVAVGGATTTTDSSGAFSLAPAPGRGLLVVSAVGKVPVTRSIGVTSESPFVSVLLVAQPAAQTIPATGGLVTAGATSLEIPSGAFPSGAQVSAAWIDRAHIGAASGAPLFVDERGTHRLVGQIHVEVSAQPDLPVSVKVTLPAGATATPVLYALENGEHTTRIEASRVASGVATFPVSHFSDYDVMLERAVRSATAEEDKILAAAWVLVAAEGGVIFDAVGKAFRPGDDVPSSTKLSGTAFTIAAPNDAQVSCGPNPVTFTTNDDGSTTVSCEGCDVHAAVAKRFIGPLRKLFIRTKTAVFGVRGTVFSVKQTPCSNAEGSAIDKVQVTEGDVDFDIGGAHFDIPAGKQAVGCEGCANPKQTTCDCDAIACDRAGGQCLVCPGQLNENYGVPINDARGRAIRNCLPKGTVCCNAENGRFSSFCAPYPEGRAICQCAGKVSAGCASPNSVCVSDEQSGREGVLDCRYGTGEAACNYQSGPPYKVGTDPFTVPARWSCLDSRAYQSDVNNCGACGHKCAGKYDACNKGKCVDCHGGCSDAQVLCGEFGTSLQRCCAFPPPQGPGVQGISCYSPEPRGEREACGREGYEVATPANSSHTIAECIQ